MPHASEIMVAATLDTSRARCSCASLILLGGELRDEAPGALGFGALGLRGAITEVVSRGTASAVLTRHPGEMFDAGRPGLLDSTTAYRNGVCSLGTIA